MTETSEETFPRVLLETNAAVTAEPSVGSDAGLWRDAGRQLIRNPTFVVGAVLFALYAVMALIPGVIAPQGIGRELCDTASGATPPSSEFIFGLDEKGCPYYPRVIYGVRPSILIGPSVAFFALTIGLTFGIIAGYYGGIVDSIISRFTDIILGLPVVLSALVFITALRNASPDDPDTPGVLRVMVGMFETIDDFLGIRGISLLVFILTVLGWTTMLRLARSATLTVKNVDYVEAARALGASDARIMFRHILPNSLAPVLAYAAIVMGAAIVAEAALSFLGVGLKTPTVSWGLQLSVAQSRLQNDPHLMFFPAVFLSGLVLSFILIGDAMRDALDPKLR